MADNVSVTPGSGKDVRTEDIGGFQHQWVVGVWGAAGAAIKPDIATGKPFPVQLRSHTGLIPIGEPTDAKSTATDGTSASGISIWKQISASVQSTVTALGAIADAAWTSGSGSVIALLKALAAKLDTLHTDLVGSTVALGNAISTGSLPVTLATDRMGSVKVVTPVVDTAIYANNEVLFIPFEITGVTHANGSVRIASLAIADKADQGVAMDIYFQSDNGTMGSLNASFAPADAQAIGLGARVQVAAADWQDFGANRVAFYDNIGQKVLADANGSVWVVGAVRSGTPTYGAAGDLVMHIGFDRD